MKENMNMEVEVEGEGQSGKYPDHTSLGVGGDKGWSGADAKASCNRQ